MRIQIIFGISVLKIGTRTESAPTLCSVTVSFKLLSKTTMSQLIV